MLKELRQAIRLSPILMLTCAIITSHWDESARFRAMVTALIWVLALHAVAIFAAIYEGLMLRDVFTEDEEGAGETSPDDQDP